jgi:hypothetical protein
MSYCIPVQKGEGKEQDQAVAVCNSMWEEHTKKSKPAEQSATDFVFVELEALSGWMDGLASGKFIAMSGEEVEFAKGDLSDYIKNTQAVIESTKTEKGEIVGLPIDKQKHDHLGGAGWIIGLELDKVRNVIRFMVNWTEEGIKLIKSNLSRFFSPSVDIENKVIIGGSLTNYPATRSANGQLILRPIELSQTIKEIDMEKTIDEIVAEKVAAELAKQQKPAEKKEEGDNALLAQFVENPEEVEQLSQQAQEMAMQMVQAEKRKSHVKEFAARVSGGTKDRPVGLPVKASEIVKVLLSLPEKQSLFIERWLEKILDGYVDFQAYGLDGAASYMPELPDNFKSLARTWVGHGKTIQEFFKVNPELGEMNRYNLAEFTKKED